MESLLEGGGGSAAASGIGGEILTVQAGTFANLVAAHLWTCNTRQFVFRSNTSASTEDNDDDDGHHRQDGDGGIDVAHDCLFREGKGALDGRATYLPRTVVVELNGLQPKVAPASLLAQSAADVGVAWRGSVQRVQVDSGSSFAVAASGGGGGGGDGEADLDSVPSWPDILDWPLHSASEVIVKQYRARDAVTPFNRYSQGDAVASDQAFVRSFDDAVHFFLEECDRPQGVQLIVDTHDGFGGLGSRLAEMLRDDHGKVPIFCIAVSAPGPSDPDSASDVPRGYRTVNQSAAITRLADACDLVIPASATGWNGARRPGDDKATSSAQGMAELLGAAVDTATLAYRMKDSSYSMGSVASQLTEKAWGTGANFSALGLSIPMLAPVLGRPGIDTLSDALGALGTTSLHSGVAVQRLTPDYTPSSPLFAAHYVVRGAGTGRLPDAALAARKSMSEYDRCRSPREMLLRHLGKSEAAKKYFVTQARSKIPALRSADSGGDGDRRRGLFSRDNAAVGWLASDIAGMRASFGVLQDQLASVSVRTKGAFADSGVTEDDMDELCERVSALTGRDKSGH